MELYVLVKQEELFKCNGWVIGYFQQFESY